MNFNVFVIILCIFVMVTLVAFFSVLIANNIKLRITIINAGLADEEILKDIQNSKKQNKAYKIIFKYIFPILFCVLIGAVFIFSLYVKTQENNCANSFCVPKVVRSDSMSYRNEKNKYLDFNNLTNQFNRFDLIFLDPLPKQEDLKIYDIVAYESNGILIIHRIVGTQEKDGETLYVLRGDANEYSDYQYVKYSQMKGIYKDKKIAFVGSAVLFLQSPAGWICIVMCAFVTLIMPIIDKKILNAINERLAIIDPQSLENKEKKKSLFASKFAKKKLDKKSKQTNDLHKEDYLELNNDIFLKKENNEEINIQKEIKDKKNKSKLIPKGENEESGNK